MKNFAKYAGILIAGILVGLVISSVSVSEKNLGGVYHQVAEYFYGGLYAGNSNEFSVSSSGALTSGSITASGDAVISGGTLNITTANTATSTVIAGCYQFYATSTNTAQKFQASTTPGVMYSQYGSCPNL